MPVVEKIKRRLSKTKKEKVTKSEHKKGLLKMYKNIFNDSDEDSFQYQLFKNAIHKLNGDVEPSKVEKWVVDMEKLFRKTL